MKEFIEKLIGRLEECEKVKASGISGVVSNYYYEMDVINAINQLAEEYKHCALCYLGSPCEYQNENAELPASEFADSDGWIPCIERLPIGEDYYKRIDGVKYYKHMLTATNDIDAPICIGWYDQEDETWYDLEGFSYHPIAWQPLPSKYTGGRKNE